MVQNQIIKVAIVGNYSIFRVALKMLLETSENLKVVAELGKISEMSGLSSSFKPDLILVDLPEEGDSTETFGPLSEHIDKVPILILTGSNSVKIYQHCLRSGINGLVLKEKNTDILFKAIKRVYEGEYWFDRAVMRDTIRDLITEKQMLAENPGVVALTILTEREKQVINLVCKGLRNREIADKLFVTETTIRHHLTSVFEKLNLSSRLELVIYSFENSLVELPKIIQSASGNTPAYNF